MIGNLERSKARQVTARAVQPSIAVIWLASLIAALSLVVAGVGLFWQDSGSPSSIITVRGESAQVYGQGLYRYDSVFLGSGNQGTDAVVLALGIPLLVLSTVLYRRGSVRGGLLLLGTLFYFFYVYTSYSLGVAYNELFLVYVALFSASLYAFVLTFTSFDMEALPAHFTSGLPRRVPALFMLASGLVTLVVWSSPLLVALSQGHMPDRLDHYTTKVTEALDIAIIVPAAFASGWLILRRAPLGYLIAFALLILEAMLAPLIVAQTVSQLAAGVSFPPGQIVGMIGGFSVLAVMAIWVIVALNRNISDSAEARTIRSSDGW
jgi:hypothetical protein